MTMGSGAASDWNRTLVAQGQAYDVAMTPLETLQRDSRALGFRHDL